MSVFWFFLAALVPCHVSGMCLIPGHGYGGSLYASGKSPIPNTANRQECRAVSQADWCLFCTQRCDIAARRLFNMPVLINDAAYNADCTHHCPSSIILTCSRTASQSYNNQIILDQYTALFEPDVRAMSRTDCFEACTGVCTHAVYRSVPGTCSTTKIGLSAAEARCNLPAANTTKAACGSGATRCNPSQCNAQLSKGACTVQGCEWTDKGDVLVRHVSWRQRVDYWWRLRSDAPGCGAIDCNGVEMTNPFLEQVPTGLSAYTWAWYRERDTTKGVFVCTANVAFLHKYQGVGMLLAENYVGGKFHEGALCTFLVHESRLRKPTYYDQDRRTSNFKQILVPITAVPTLARVERYAGLTNALVDYRQHLVSHTGVQEEMVAVLGNVSLGTGLLTDTDALKLLDQQITFDRSEWKTLANQNVTTLASNNHYVGIGFRKFDVVNNTIEFPVPTFYDVFTAEVISNEMGRNTKLCLRSTFEPCVDFVKRQSLQGSFEANGFTDVSACNGQCVTASSGNIFTTSDGACSVKLSGTTVDTSMCPATNVFGFDGTTVKFYNQPEADECEDAEEQFSDHVEVCFKTECGSNNTRCESNSISYLERRGYSSISSCSGGCINASTNGHFSNAGGSCSVKISQAGDTVTFDTSKCASVDHVVAGNVYNMLRHIRKPRENGERGCGLCLAPQSSTDAKGSSAAAWIVCSALAVLAVALAGFYVYRLPPVDEDEDTEVLLVLFY